MNECPKCGGSPIYDLTYAEPWGDNTYVEFNTCAECGCKYERLFDYVRTEEQ